MRGADPCARAPSHERLHGPGLAATAAGRAALWRLRYRGAVALHGIAWEAIFVDDDSPDGTWKVAKQLAMDDVRVRCIRRVGRRGLAGACGPHGVGVVGEVHEIWEL